MRPLHHFILRLKGFLLRFRQFFCQISTIFSLWLLARLFFWCPNQFRLGILHHFLILCVHICTKLSLPCRHQFPIVLSPVHPTAMFEPLFTAMFVTSSAKTSRTHFTAMHLPLPLFIDTFAPLSPSRLPQFLFWCLQISVRLISALLLTQGPAKLSPTVSAQFSLQ